MFRTFLSVIGDMPACDTVPSSLLRPELPGEVARGIAVQQWASAGKGLGKLKVIGDGKIE
jgi:hypothetical protein